MAEVGISFDPLDSDIEHIAELNLSSNQIKMRFDEVLVIVSEQWNIDIPIFINIKANAKIIRPGLFRFQCWISLYIDQTCQYSVQ